RTAGTVRDRDRRTLSWKADGGGQHVADAVTELVGTAAGFADRRALLGLGFGDRRRRFAVAGRGAGIGRLVGIDRAPALRERLGLREEERRRRLADGDL